MSRVVLVLLVFAALCGAPERASAQSCAAVASTVDFGSVNPIALSAVDATGTVTVTCTWPAVTLTPNAQVCLNLGGASPRTLVNGANALQYDLYQDASHSLVWGAVSNGTTPIALTLSKPALATSAVATVTIYGRIAANQPTVPTVNNSSTLYTASFSGNATSLNAGFYLLAAPTCASLTTSNGTLPFSVNATVLNDCFISATNVSFAATGVLDAALGATGSITAQCTNGDGWRIALNGGASSNVASRSMQRVGGGGAVSYQLYLDAAHTSPWGDGTAGTAMATGVGTGNQQVVNVYGLVPAQATPAPGNYSDTITATISF